MEKLKAPAGIPAPDRNAAALARLARNRTQGRVATPTTLAVVPDARPVEEPAAEPTVADRAEARSEIAPAPAEPATSATQVQPTAEPAAIAAAPEAPTWSYPDRGEAPQSAVEHSPATTGRALATPFAATEVIRQRSVSLSGATMHAIRQWERARRRSGQRGLGTAALIAAACVDLPTEVPDALDLVGITPDKALDGGRFQATVYIPVSVSERLTELRENIGLDGMNGRIVPWHVVAAAVNRQLDAEGGFGFGTVASAG